MADPNVVAGQMLNNDQAARAVVERYGSEERRQRLAAYYPAPLPNVVQEPLRHAAFQSELLAGITEIIEGMATAQAAANAPKKRGRPRKDGEPVETSQHAAMDAVEETAATD